MHLNYIATIKDKLTTTLSSTIAYCISLSNMHLFTYCICQRTNKMVKFISLAELDILYICDMWYMIQSLYVECLILLTSSRFFKFILLIWQDKQKIIISDNLTFFRTLYEIHHQFATALNKKQSNFNRKFFSR